MSANVNGPKRRYNGQRRAVTAADTRASILAAAKTAFERGGWAGTTVAAIAERARVSPKTVEALFGTKAAVLHAVVDYAIRGDGDNLPIVRRDAALAIEQAPTAATMLDLDAAMVVAINARSAQIAWVVEAAAPADERVAEIWKRMTTNLRHGVRWAAATLLEKPGVRPDLTELEAEEIFHIARIWSTYRSLTRTRRLSADAAEAWIGKYYQRMLLSSQD